MTQDEIIEMARQAGFTVGYGSPALSKHETFAKLVAAKAVAKDREEFDIDELCARQNKIGYKQGYRAGQLEEREACALIGDGYHDEEANCGDLIRARGEA